MNDICSLSHVSTNRKQIFSSSLLITYEMTKKRTNIISEDVDN